MNTSLNAYYSELDKALRKQTKFANFNRDLSHATIVVCTALRHAQSRVKLLSQCLDISLYGSQWFLDELDGFLKRDGTLEILIECDVSEEHPVFQFAKQSERVVIKRIPDEVQTMYKWNFMLVDDIGFRFEKDRESTEASVVFHYDSEFLEARNILTKWFDEQFSVIEQSVA